MYRAREAFFHYPGPSPMQFLDPHLHLGGGHIRHMGLGRLASVIHPYPTHADAIRKLGDAFNRTRLTLV